MGGVKPERVTTTVACILAALGLLGLAATPLLIWSLGEWWPRAMLCLVVLAALVYSVGRVVT